MGSSIPLISFSSVRTLMYSQLAPVMVRHQTDKPSRVWRPSPWHWANRQRPSPKRRSMPLWETPHHQAPDPQPCGLLALGQSGSAGKGDCLPHLGHADDRRGRDRDFAAPEEQRQQGIVGRSGDPPHRRRHVAAPHIVAALDAAGLLQDLPPAVSRSAYASTARPPAWSDYTDTPSEGDRCSCGRSGRWWTAQSAPDGWCCSMCHPPPLGRAVREAVTKPLAAGAQRSSEA